MHDWAAPTIVSEARLEQLDGGLAPATAGWFVVNVGDARAQTSSRLGSWCSFESPEHRFDRFGINVHVLQPGQPNCMYHREPEPTQEAFLVLSGECILIIEGQERRLVAGDFVHCPPMTAHVFVGAGAGPCSILMVGSRDDFNGGGYPVDPVAQRHGASVQAATDAPEVAYRDLPASEPTRLDWPISS